MSQDLDVLPEPLQMRQLHVLDSSRSGTFSRLRAAGSSLRALLSSGYLPLTAMTTLALVVAVIQGLPLLAVASLAVALVTDAAAISPPAPGAKRLSGNGLTFRVRTLIRGVLVLVCFSVVTAGDFRTVVWYAVAVLAVQFCWYSFHSSLSRVLALTSRLAVRNLDLSPNLATLIPRVRRHRAQAPAVFLAIDCAVATAIAAELVFGPFGRSWLTVSAGLGIGAMIAVAVTVEWWSLRFQASDTGGRYDDAVQAELERFDPEAIVYLAAGPGQIYIFDQWLSAFNASSKRLIFVSRQYDHVVRLGKTRWPVIYAPGTRDVERCVLPGVRVAFYCANAGQNVQLLREAGVKHVFLNHGDSDKATSANPVARVYDEVWVAGPAAIERYLDAGVDIARERFAVIGRPQVDGLKVGPRAERAPRRIFYAPTWEGYYEEANYSSLEVMGMTMIERIIAERPDYGIIFKPHPGSGRQRRAMIDAWQAINDRLRSAPNANLHLLADDHPKASVYDWFEQADVLISDISSVVTDFLHTERPIIVSNPRSLPHDMYVRMFPSQRASYVLDADCEALLALIDVALGEDPLLTERRAMKRELLGDLPDGPLAAFAANVDRIYEQGCLDLAAVRNRFAFEEAHVEPFSALN